MTLGCTYEGCTVADTRRCALERDPETCSNRLSPESEREGAAAAAIERASDLGAPVLSSPAEHPSFPRSDPLGPEQMEALMAKRYVTVVGILGDPETGKTACLASLYLLASNALLDGWSFADSRSLMAFEEISRGTRRWNEGHPPDQMTVRTEMADERRPGFLHIRLKRHSDGRRVDLALPDLPGEWTKALVRSSRSDRLAFLNSADVIWIFLDGRKLADRVTRQGIISRLGQLAARLAAVIGVAPRRLLLVVTHRDAGGIEPAVRDRIASELAKHGAEAELVPVAPFSDVDTVRAGFGLSALIDATVAPSAAADRFWPSTSPAGDARSYLSYRRDQ